MLLLRATRASPAASTMAAAVSVRSKSTRLTSIASLSSSSGGRRRKGKTPPPPPPPPQLRGGEFAGKKGKKKPESRTAGERKGAVPAAAPKSLAQEGVRRKKPPPPPMRQQQEKAKEKRVMRWKCAAGCGACCKLDKGPDFPTPEEIFAEHPEDLKLYKSMIGTDGWCTNYDKSTRTCNIYEGSHKLRNPQLPPFCAIACVDTIKMVYGEDSAELTNFKRVIREESKKHEASLNQDKLLDT
uniref:Uncharacterized protein n=1 Tax=Leersia perrieri TaxID=77586 RepID=A0A0D9VU94_9ORYZ